MNPASLHHAIVTSFLERLRPPTVRELAERFACEESEARAGLRALAEYHGVVLHPATDEVHAAHPFSAAPTTFVVRAGASSWWGTCAWCSLGLAHLAGGNATIEARLGAIDAHVTIRLEDGVIRDTDLVVHFPIPMRRAWDDVMYTCSVMLFFRDEAAVDAWCATRGVPKGDVRPIAQISALAAEWYGRHADAEWTKWSRRQAIEIFERHGLTGPIWSLSSDAARF